MRKYFKSTIDYIKANWLSVLLHVLIPTALYTYFINPTSSFDYIMENIKTLNPDRAIDVFLRINDSSYWSNWQYIVFYVVVLIGTLVVFSSFIGNIQNKMRYGKTIYPGFMGVLKRTNENFFATIRAGIMLIIAMEFFALVMSLIIYFAIKVTSIAALRIIIVCFIAAIIIALMFYGLAWVSCALPNMTMRNEGIFKSISRSMEMVGKKQIKIFLSLFIPIVVSYIPLIVCSAFDIVYDHLILTIIRYIVKFGFYLFSFAYYIILMYVVFFDINEIEREDLNLENKWRL